MCGSCWRKNTFSSGVVYHFQLCLPTNDPKGLDEKTVYDKLDEHGAKDDEGKVYEKTFVAACQDLDIAGKKHKPHTVGLAY